MSFDANDDCIHPVQLVCLCSQGPQLKPTPCRWCGHWPGRSIGTLCDFTEGSGNRSRVAEEVKDGLFPFLTLKTGENHVERPYSMSLGRYSYLVCVGIFFLRPGRQNEAAAATALPVELERCSLFRGSGTFCQMEVRTQDEIQLRSPWKAAAPGLNRYVVALPRHNSGTAVSTTVHHCRGVVSAEAIHLGDVVLLSLKESSRVWIPACIQVPRHF